jgi:nicotinate-nucleotide--dimethylbenzimidazole phosphoribosyltransferase
MTAADLGATVATVAARIRPPDPDARAEATARQAGLTKPAGSLGALEELSVWAAGVQGRCPPQPFARVRLVLLAADHGVATAGVSAYPAEVTAQMVANFLAGGAAVNVLARQHGVGVRVVDIGVDADVPGADAALKVRRGSGRLDIEDALTTPELAAAVTAGLALADAEVDAGADLLVPGDMGIGSTTACAALVGALLALEADDVVGLGTGIDPAGRARKVDVVARALARTSRRRDPLDLLAALGGADLAAMTGLLLGAAARRTPVLLDGVVSCAAALVASRIAPEAVAWWRAGHRSTEPSQRRALEAMRLEPLLDLGLRLGEGTGALAALPLVQSSIALLAEMATFGEAGVSEAGG